MFNDCELKIKLLAKYNVGTILDYSVEGVGLKDDFQSTVTEIKKTIDAADNSLDIPFSVFKLTGLTSFSILKAANDSLDDLNSSQLFEYNDFIDRVDQICSYAVEKNVKIFIDAEDSWFQGSIDRVAEQMMKLYNQKNVIVYTTIQFYRWDRFRLFE